MSTAVPDWEWQCQWLCVYHTPAWTLLLTIYIHTFFCFVLTWHSPIPPYDSGMFYDVPDYSRQHPDYSHYSHELSDLMSIMLPYSALLIAQSVSSGHHMLSSYTLTHRPPQQYIRRALQVSALQSFSHRLKSKSHTTYAFLYVYLLVLVASLCVAYRYSTMQSQLFSHRLKTSLCVAYSLQPSRFRVHQEVGIWVSE